MGENVLGRFPSEHEYQPVLAELITLVEILGRFVKRMETHMIHALLDETQKVDYHIVQLGRLLETMRWAQKSLRADFLYHHEVPEENGHIELDRPIPRHMQVSGIPRHREKLHTSLVVEDRV